MWLANAWYFTSDKARGKKLCGRYVNNLFNFKTKINTLRKGLKKKLTLDLQPKTLDLSEESCCVIWHSVSFQLPQHVESENWWSKYEKCSREYTPCLLAEYRCFWRVSSVYRTVSNSCFQSAIRFPHHSCLTLPGSTGEKSIRVQFESWKTKISQNSHPFFWITIQIFKYKYNNLTVKLQKQIL